MATLRGMSDSPEAVPAVQTPAIQTSQGSLFDRITNFWGTPRRLYYNWFRSDYVKRSLAMRTSISKRKSRSFPAAMPIANCSSSFRTQPMPFKSQGRHPDAFMFVWNLHGYWRPTPARRWTKAASSHC